MKLVELTLILIFASIFISKLQGDCSVEEREALLSFKQSLFDPHRLLSIWRSDVDCCTWKGVGCNNITDHVIKLDFLWNSGQPSLYAAYLNVTLLSRLQHLQYLCLVGIYFRNASIPQSINSLTSLLYLDLSSSGFSGTIPPQLGNLTNLQYLDLNGNLLATSNLQWISQLSSLQYLDMGQVDLSLATNWLDEISMLPTLLTLALDYCNLQTLPTSLSYFNFSSTIDTIEISNNQFSNSKIPSWLSNMTNLSTLFMYSCQLHGMIPSNLLGALKLIFLDLSDNLIDGIIPPWIGKMTNLTYIDLSYNNLSGPIPHNLGQMINMNNLDFSNNQLQDSLSNVHFANLSQLVYLELSNNILDFSMISSYWVPPFQIQSLYLSYCFIGPHFPLWIQTQNYIYVLDLSKNSISDSIPSWFWNISSHFVFLDMSYNAIKGELPMALNVELGIDLRSNNLEGNLPQLNSSIRYILFSNNKFLRGIEQYLNPNMSSLDVLDLSENFLFGRIPDSICQMPKMTNLYLSHNNFFGEIPKCKGNISSFLTLNVINLANNNFWGVIPHWMANLPMLLSLHLTNNNFQGGLPFLRNCSKLIILDMGQNKLMGNIPSWIGDVLSSLKILCLQSNKFYGPIPFELSKLKGLQILDLSDNFLSGSLPNSFKFLNSMSTPIKKLVPVNPQRYVDFTNFSSSDSLIIDIKGVEREFKEILSLVIMMYLSCNKLSGDIPTELMSLAGLISLNLSNNQFAGQIPINIGLMQSLESLDLSKNYFSGEIPESIVKLTKLSTLNLSYNRLSGRIPEGTQLETFNESSYYGNPKLCGKSLHKACQGDEDNIHNRGSSSYDDDDDDDDDFGLFLGMGIGFTIGLWSVLGILLLKKS